MQVLMLPYLYFRDFARSSGVIHQAEIAKALAGALQLGGVTVLLPRREDGWVYDPEEYFGGCPNLATIEVRLAKNQSLWSGIWHEDLQRYLIPTRSPLAFDVVLNMVPPTAIGLKRLLGEVGFSRIEIPVVNVHDTVSDPTNKRKGGGVRDDFKVPLMHAEVINGMHDIAITTTEFEHRTLVRNIRAVLAPSLAREALERAVFMPKPLRLPEPVRRTPPAPGEDWQVLIARSFGKSFEESDWEGPECHTALIDAVVNLRRTGLPIRLVICTRSALTDWSRQVLADAGDAVELVHDRPRTEVLERMRGAHVVADLRTSDSLFLAAIEQAASGAPNIVRDGNDIRGTVDSPWAVSSFEATELMAVLKTVIDDYDAARARAIGLARAVWQRHAPELFGRNLADLMRDLAHPFKAQAFRTLYPLFVDAMASGELEAFGGCRLEDAIAAVERRSRSGRLHRYPKVWFLKMLRAIGFGDGLVGRHGEQEIRLGLVG